MNKRDKIKVRDAIYLVRRKSERRSLRSPSTSKQ